MKQIETSISTRQLKQTMKSKASKHVSTKKKRGWPDKERHELPGVVEVTFSYSTNMPKNVVWGNLRQ